VTSKPESARKPNGCSNWNKTFDENKPAGTVTQGMLINKKPTYRQGEWAHFTAQVSMWQPPQYSCGKCPNLPPQREEEFKKG
jgi:hypothetical protein